MQTNKNIDNLIFETIFNTCLPESPTLRFDVLTESYNMYDGIYQDVEKITDVIIDMLQSGKFDIPYETPYSGKSLNIKTLKIELLTHCETFNGACSLTDKCLFLKINTGLMLRHLDYGNIREIISRWVENTIVHELTHVKNETEALIKYDEDKTPEWYNAAVDSLMGENKLTGLPHIFFYDLYLSYFSEIQAISAQVFNEVDNIIKQTKNWNKLSKQEQVATIKQLVLGSKYAKTYLIIKIYQVPMLKNLTLFDKQEIISKFKAFNIDVTEKDINKFIKQIEYGADRALAKIRRSLNGLFVKYNLV